MPDLRIYPDRELLVKPLVCQDAITIGAFIDVDHSIDLLKRRSSPPYTMGGIAPFIKEPEVDPIQEVF